jgi:RimJ/RimL family protein N-acetyltransferase
MRTLHTARLILRAFTQNDLDAVHLWDPTANAAQDFLDYCFREYRDRNLGPWAMQLNTTGFIVGNCGFPHLDLKHHTGEINYYVAPSYRQQGFATEALNALLEFGFTDLALDKIQGRCPPDNPASERVLQKVGMRFERMIQSATAEEKFFCILKKEFGTHMQTR